MKAILPVLVLTLLACGASGQPLRRGLQSPHLVVDYDARDEAFAQVVSDAGEQAWPNLQSALRLPDSTPAVRVYLVRTQAEFDRLAGQTMKPWVIGVAVPGPRRIVLKTVNLPSLKVLTVHELTHVFLDDRAEKLGIEPPRWLHEGLALLSAGELDAGERDALHDATVQRRLLPISKLDAAFGGRADVVTLAYAQSYTLVSFLEQLRPGSIADLLDSLAASHNLEEAFVRTYGVTSTELQQQWLQQVQTGNLSPAADWLVELLIFALMAVIALVAFRVQGVKRRRIRERLREEERLRMQDWLGLRPPDDE